MSTLNQIAENKRARFDYSIIDTYECGMVLVGSEVKSLRARHVNFGDAYALLKNHEVFLLGLKIEPYTHGTHENHETDRTRKLLLNRKEIKKIERDTARKGLSLIPLKLYFKDGRAKVLIAIAEGKSKGDKRDTIKQREADREVARVMHRGQR
ncbi:MAG: SsrA-binding protein SmpB [Myxococcota bacterium]